jgi:AraC-like DNA-binding protein
MTGVDLFLARFGSTASPYYEETEPAADLRALVACNWVRVVRLAGAPALAPILPDGCADVMVYDDAPPRVAGPDATTRWVSIPEGTVIVGLRLRPGAVRSVFGCPADSILGGGARLSDLAPGARALHQRLLATAHLPARQALLEDWVRAAVARAATVDHAVVAACRMLTSDAHVAIGALAQRLGWNARTLHRQFRGACGYGPKHFQRVMRVQRAIRAVHAAGAPRLADVAQAAGYADQAHMTRDFRDITGFTPRSSFAMARPEFGAWIDEAW